MRKISNSEATTWMHCKRKYYYEYIQDLEPKNFSGPISKGILIHSMLEQYYLEKMDGSDETACRKAAFEPVTELMGKPNTDLTELLKIKSLVDGYFENYEESDRERYEVVGVETQFNIPLTNAYSLVGTIDALFLDKEDGRFVAVDHKTSYNFWTDEQTQVSGQFVKYLVGLRERGFDVKSFMVNQIRTRDLKEGNELYRRAWVMPSDNRIYSVLNQHARVSQEIVDFRSNPEKNAAYPIYDKQGCANCAYFALCDSDSEGAPTDHLILQEYNKRTRYGYNTATENINE